MIHQQPTCTRHLICADRCHLKKPLKVGAGGGEGEVVMIDGEVVMVDGEVMMVRGGEVIDKDSTVAQAPVHCLILFGIHHNSPSEHT